MVDFKALTLKKQQARVWDHGPAIARLAGDDAAHSLFAPSSSAGWLVCADYIIANASEEDDAGEDAAYGTVGHEVAEDWLLRIDESRTGNEAITERMIVNARPSERVGEVVTVREPSGTFDITIDNEMLAYVSQYISWCVELKGAHYIEQRVDFSRLTPIPNQKGTADHAACYPGVLTITDLKMGRSPDNIVFAAEHDDDPRALIDGKFNGNPQAMLYALGFFFEHDHKYDFQRIVIRIAQPRLEHFHVWETTREELLAFAKYVEIRAAAAWKKDRPRTPSPKGCRWCKLRRKCGALATWTLERLRPHARRYGNDGEEIGVIEVDYAEVTSDQIVEAKRRAIDMRPKLPNPSDLTTEELERFFPMRKAVESFFRGIEDELILRHRRGQPLLHHKEVPGRLGRREWLDKDERSMAVELDMTGLRGEDRYTKKIASPATAEERIKTKYGLTKKQAASVISHLVWRQEGRPTLVPTTDRREELEDLTGRATVYDDEGEEGL